MKSKRFLLSAFCALFLLCHNLPDLYAQVPPAVSTPATSAGVTRLIAQAQADLAVGRFTDALAKLQASPLDVSSTDKAALQMAVASIEYAWGESLFAKSPDQALPHFQAALTIDQAMRPSQAADDFIYLGATYVSLKQFEKALDTFNQALPLYLQYRDNNGQANVLEDVGVAYKGLGQFNKAVEFFEKALALNRQISNKRGEENSLMNLGSTYGSLNQNGKAIDMFQQVLQLLKRDGDMAGQASALNNLGSAYRSLGQYDKAIDLFQQAIALHRRSKNKTEEAEAILNLGNAYAAMAQLTEANIFYQQALPLFQATDDRQGEATTQSQINDVSKILQSEIQAVPAIEQAQADQQAGRFPEAIARLQDLPSDMSPLDKKTAQRAVADVQFAWAESLLADNPSQVLLHCQAALGIDQALRPSRVAADLLIEGIACEKISQYTKAIDFFQKALPIYQQFGDKVGQANTLGNEGNAYRHMGEGSKAIDVFQEALSIFRENGDLDNQATTLRDIGTSYFALGQMREAIDFYKQAVPIFHRVGNKTEVAKTSSDLELARRMLTDQRPLTTSVATSPSASGPATTATTLDLIERAQASQNAGRFTESIALLQSSYLAAPSSDKKAMRLAIADVQFAWAESLLPNSPTLALPHYQSALDIDLVLRPAKAAADYLGIGNAQVTLSQYGKAISSFQQALTIFHHTFSSFLNASRGDATKSTLEGIFAAFGEGMVLRNLGRTSLLTNQYKKGLDYYKQSLAICRRVAPREGGEAESLYGVGNAYFNLGQYAEAALSYKQALSIFQQIGDKDGTARTRHNLGVVAKHLKIH